MATMVQDTLDYISCIDGKPCSDRLPTPDDSLFGIRDVQSTLAPSV